MQSVWISKNDYERRIRAVSPSSRFSLVFFNPQISCLFCILAQLLSALSEIQTHWSASKFTGTYTDAKGHSSDFAKYKQTTKRTWVTERQDVTTLFGNVQTKLRTYGLREYVPPKGLALPVSAADLSCLGWIKISNLFPSSRPGS